jgi:hypothetical protein
LGHPAHHNFLLWELLYNHVDLGGCSKTPGKASDLGGVQKHPGKLDFAGAPLLGGGDEDEWETWCTEHSWSR